MINTKSSMQGSLAIAALAMAGSSLHTTKTLPCVPRKRQQRNEEYFARQKRLAESGLTQDQQQWNKAVDAKRAAKKSNK